jgi:hypothetical protein
MTLPFFVLAAIATVQVSAMLYAIWSALAWSYPEAPDAEDDDDGGLALDDVPLPPTSPGGVARPLREATARRTRAARAHARPRLARTPQRHGVPR